MGISKVILNGAVKVDLTQDTVDETNLLAGETATGADGEAVEGAIASKASADLTVSGATVTAPAGFYSAAASKSVATTTHPNPTASINSTTGVVTASHTQGTGYVTGGTTTGTLNLTTQAGKTVTPTETEQTVVAAGRYTTGAVKVGAISSTYIGSDIAQNDSDDLTVSGDTVNVPAGYYAEAASKAVASGTAGTPTATKGTVTNHSVSVTPSVTNATGYITGGTKNGTAVTVSASELVSGTLTISSSGTKDVTNYASASVATGSATTPATTITANPSISVSSSGLITASVSGSKSVTPTVSAGYVSSGTAGTVSVSGSNTEQLSTQGATTITPTTSSQTAVAAGKYTTGAVTVGAIPSEYIIPAGSLEITENGEGIDVSQYAEVDVAVPGQIPTGVKYIWTDYDLSDQIDISGYQYVSIDGSPVHDGTTRIWLSVEDNDTVSIKVTAGGVDWGDGYQDTITSSGYVTLTHEYATKGYYLVIILPMGTANKFANLASDAFAGEDTINKVKSIELDYTDLFNQAVQTSVAAGSASLLSVTFYANTLSGYVVQNCTSLRRVVIGEAVTIINGYSNFSGCSSLRQIYIKPTNPPTLNATSSFSGIPSDCVFYVPYSADHSILAAYQSATNWSTFASHMQEEPQ